MPTKRKSAHKRFYQYYRGGDIYRIAEGRYKGYFTVPRLAPRRRFSDLIDAQHFIDQHYDKIRQGGRKR